SVGQDGDGGTTHILLSAGGHVVYDAARYVLEVHGITFELGLSE
ncbi:MAG: hypothetical protein ACI8PG_004069, partial [Planctomycetota bacterium]